MKQIKKTTTSHYNGIMNAIQKLQSDFEFEVKSPKMFDGCIQIIVDGSDKSLSVWTDGKDYFATPDWALDWADGEWDGMSANGQFFTINNCEPMVVEY